MTTQEKFNLAKEVHEKLNENFYYPKKFGAILAYLYEAILFYEGEVQVDLYIDEGSDANFISQLKENFPDDHAVWKYVKIDKFGND